MDISAQNQTLLVSKGPLDPNLALWLRNNMAAHLNQHPNKLFVSFLVFSWTHCAHFFMIVTQIPADDDFSLQEGDEDLAKALQTMEDQAIDAQIMVNILLFQIADECPAVQFVM